MAIKLNQHQHGRDTKRIHCKNMETRRQKSVINRRRACREIGWKEDGSWTILSNLKWFELNTKRAIIILLCRAIQFQMGGSKKINRVNPAQFGAARQQPSNGESKPRHGAINSKLITLPHQSSVTSSTLPTSHLPPRQRPIFPIQSQTWINRPTNR